MNPLLLPSGAVLALLAACSTSPVSYPNSIPVPKDRVMLASLTDTTPGTGRITVTRDAGIAGGACSYKLFVDGKAVAVLNAAERIDLYVAPGSHILGVKAASSLCDVGTSEISASISAEEWKRYRIGTDKGANASLQPTAF